MLFAGLVAGLMWIFRAINRGELLERHAASIEDLESMLDMSPPYSAHGVVLLQYLMIETQLAGGDSSAYRHNRGVLLVSRRHWLMAWAPPAYGLMHASLQIVGFVIASQVLLSLAAPAWSTGLLRAVVVLPCLAPLIFFWRRQALDHDTRLGKKLWAVRGLPLDDRVETMRSLARAEIESGRHRYRSDGTAIFDE